MKKRRFILLAACLMICLLLTGCKKKSLSINEFNDIAKKNEFTIVDVGDIAKAYDHLSEVAVVENKDGWRVEYYIIVNKEEAIAMYNLNKTTFEENKSGIYAESTVDVSNYSTYALETDGKYMYIARVDNTMIYLKVDQKYKNDAKDFIKKLGY